MSGFNTGEYVWIGDLDCYININSADYRDDEEIDGPDGDLRCNGLASSLELLGGEFIEPIWCNLQIAKSEWKFELYRAKRYLREEESWEYLEPLLIKSILSEGRKYAVRRYAMEENIPVNEAIIAALPNGLQALLSQFLTRHQISLSKYDWQKLHSTIQNSVDSKQLTAYSKTTLIRNWLLNSIYGIDQYKSTSKLDLKLLRILLSQVRLYFSVKEIAVISFSDLISIEDRYKIQKNKAYHDDSNEYSSPTRIIKNWKIRHLRSLLYYYPYEFRHAISRGHRQ